MASKSKLMGMGNIGSMLKEGTKHLSGIDEATARNIEAIKGLSDLTRTSFGPNGMNKMVINHLEKLFVTADAATIVIIPSFYRLFYF
jgi:T-complex protein 1 subunit theta